MELPQPRPFGTQGRKTTHDFLPLYDPRPPQGGHLKTHDFLQPLERAGKSFQAKEETNKVEIEAVDKSPSVEHILPGGIGTYSISYVHQRAVPKPDAPETSTHRNDDNSNGTSYTGSVFTLWDESSVVNKGKTGKENLTVDRRILREAGVNSGGGQRWPSQSSSDHKHNTPTLSSLSSAQKSPSPALKNQSFLHMITSAKNAQEYDDDDDEEEFVIKKEPRLHPRGSLSVQYDGKSSDQKPNTPRSKHSATEQRRRSKINDRFQMLREFIPHSDQKRDKASFLLEVIEYIRFLQEKVHKFEGSYQGWDNEPSKLPRSKCHRTTQGNFDHAQGASSASSAEVVYAGKLDENKMRIPSTNPINVNKLETDKSTSAVKESSPQHDLTNKEATTLSMQPSANCASSSIAGLHSSMLTADTDQLELKSQPQFWLSRSHMTDAVANAKLRGQDLSIESGTISFSSVYSQGLLNTLTQALQNSGVDLSQASISMKIDIGERANGSIQDEHVYTSNQPIPQSIITSTGESSDRALKRLKTSQT